MLAWLAPLPRLRLYTTIRVYVRVFYEIIAGKAWRGKELTVLSDAVRIRFGVRNAIPMPLARVAIYATVKAIIKPGQTVIMSPYTIADVVNMVICAGGRPVFADTERGTCNIDARAVEALIDDSTGAVLVTHFYGLMCDVERIDRICQTKGVPMIEDAAQAFGATRNGRHAGTWGKAGIFSFGLFKNVNSFFGGLVVTNDDTLAARIRCEIKKWPFQPLGTFINKVGSALITDIITFPPIFRTFTYWIFRWAYLHEIDVINDRLKIDVAPKMKSRLPDNYKIQMTPLQARLVLDQLDGVDEMNAARMSAAQQWYAGLNDLPGLLLPPLLEDGSHIYWHFPIQFDNRHDLVAFALRHGCDITESYHRNCASLSCFADFSRSCPNAQATADSLIYLPTYPRYSHTEISKCIRVIRAYFNRRA